MLKKLLLSTALTVAGTSGLVAQGFTGGSIGIKFGALSDLDGTERTTFSGSAEYAITPSFAAALDVAFYNYSDLPSDTELSNYTLHGIYALNEDVKLGVWLGRDIIRFISDGEIDYYGVEAAYSSGPVSAQGYLGHGDSQGTEFTLMGGSGAYGFGNGVAGIAAFDYVDIPDGDTTLRTVEIGASYEIVSGASVYATVGNFTVDGMGGGFDEAFYSIGATFSFGPDGGTSFDQRSYLELPLPL